MAKFLDGASPIPWSCGKTLLWDFTCPDTFAASNLINTSRIAGAAAESRKEKKYSAFSPAHIFVPVAIKTMGLWWPVGCPAWQPAGCDTFQTEAGCGCSERKCHLGYGNVPRRILHTQRCAPS